MFTIFAKSAFLFTIFRLALIEVIEGYNR